MPTSSGTPPAGRDVEMLASLLDIIKNPDLHKQRLAELANAAADADERVQAAQAIEAKNRTAQADMEARDAALKKREVAVADREAKVISAENWLKVARAEYDKKLVRLKELVS